MTNVHARTPAEILAPKPELRIPSAAAQARIVSGGEFWPSQRELSRLFKYMACARIPEFESYHPSQAVVSLRGRLIGGLDVQLVDYRGLSECRASRFAAQSSLGLGFDLDQCVHRQA
jgi:hypothetical protein